jgi:hypothetical protein
MRNDFNFDADLSTPQDGKNLTDRENRGLEVILTAYIDGLDGFPNVILSPDRSPALCDSLNQHFPKILGL